MKKSAVFLLATAALASAASADSINQSQIVDAVTPFNMNPQTFNFAGYSVTVSPYSRGFGHKTVGNPNNIGATGVGVVSMGNTAGNEIDNNVNVIQSEFIRFTFSKPVRITSLNICHLYHEGEFNDAIDEQAVFVVNQDPLGNTAAFNAALAGAAKFTANGATVGTQQNFNAFSTYANTKLAVDGVNDGSETRQGGGAWQFNNGWDLFGVSGYVTSLTLVPKAGNPNATARQSDFSFEDIQFTAVPSPLAATIGFVGLGLVARRRRLA